MSYAQNVFNQPQAPQPNQPHMIKSVMDRSYLETVHEEDLTSTEDTSKSTDSSNSSANKTAITSLSVQPFVSSTVEADSSNEKADKPENQLYEQLSQLKPLRSKSFKSSTSICLNVTPQSAAETNIMSSSMIITPSKSISDNEININNEKNEICLTVQPPEPLNKSEAKLNVRFSDSPTTQLLKNEVTTKVFNPASETYKLISFNKNGSSDEAKLNHIRLDNCNDKIQNENSAETLISKSCLEINCNTNETNKLEQSASNSLFINELNNGKSNTNNKSVSTMVIPRRNSALIPTSSNSALSSSISNAPRRVSLSVTDL